MKSQIFYKFLFFIITLFSSHQSFSQAACIKLSSDKFRWMINQQLDSLNDILHDNVSYIHSNGWVQSKKDVIDDFKKNKVKMTKVLVYESKETNVGNTSMINGKGLFEGLIEGKEFSVELIYTEIYVLQNNSWKLLSRHACKLSSH